MTLKSRSIPSNNKVNNEKPLPPVVILGAGNQGGIYILRINVPETLRLAFGRFKKGKSITLPPGEYVYVGSAQSEKGAMSLGRRLVRHATRSGGKKPHKIRTSMIESFASVGLGTGDLLPRRSKRLHWNIDHLLDQDSVELVGVIVIRSPAKLDAEIGKLLENDPCTAIIEEGLGASDVSGNTHILRLEHSRTWWREFLQELRLSFR